MKRFVCVCEIRFGGDMGMDQEVCFVLSMGWSVHQSIERHAGIKLL